jgi:BolA protein
MTEQALVDLIQSRLMKALQPDVLEVWDDSKDHEGHAGAASGAGHYQLLIRAPAFRGLRPVARHRLVYDALADLMPHRIHALAIDAKAPDETF